jgi:hypothetical protein
MIVQVEDNGEVCVGAVEGETRGRWELYFEDNRADRT